MLQSTPAMAGCAPLVSAVTNVLQQKSFARSVSTLAGGSALAQLIALVSLPLMTRIFPPPEYGHYVIFMAYAGFFVPISSARFEVAIVLPRLESSAIALAVGSLVTVTGTSALALSLLLMAQAGGFDVCTDGLVLVPLYALFAGYAQVFTNLQVRARRFTRLSTSRVLQAFTTAAATLLGGMYYSAHFTTLVWAAILGQLVGLCFLLPDLDQARSTLQLRPRGVLRLMRHFRKLALFNVPHVLSDAAQSSGLPLAIGAWFGPQATAFYSFAVRLLKAPLGLVSSSISQVYYPNAAATGNDVQKLRANAQRMLAMLALGASILLMSVLCLPDGVYGIVFGAEWAQAGHYIRTLAPWMLASFVASPLTVLFLVREKFGLHFAFSLGATLVAFLLLVASHLMKLMTLDAMLALSFGMTVYIALAVFLEFRVVLGKAATRE